MNALDAHEGPAREHALRNETATPEAPHRVSQFRDLWVSMQEAVSQSIFSYWNALRGNRRAPKRFEIEPSCIANNLPDTFILERVDESNVRFRLAGTRITEALGMELRGRNLFELFDAQDARTLKGQLNLVASHCAVSHFRMSASNTQGFSTTFEVLILPLTHTRDTVERFLGSLTSIEKPGWLGAVPLTERTLIDHEIMWPDGRSLTKSDRAGYEPPILHARRAARIVHSERRRFRVFDGGLGYASEE